MFAFGHFFGWVIKAILLRHYFILWTLSINWEITEVAFSHILPNFQECWWDSIILDILLCNGLGIFCGMLLCQWFHARSYQWESIRDIPSKRGKLKRAVLQFTPVRYDFWYAFKDCIGKCRLIWCVCIGLNAAYISENCKLLFTGLDISLISRFKKGISVSNLYCLRNKA